MGVVAYGAPGSRWSAAHHPKPSVIHGGNREVEKEAGRGGLDAVVEASLVRFRPITLDTQAMIPRGMAPIAPTVFRGPMALRHHGRGRGGHRADADLSLPSLYITWFKTGRRRTDRSDRRLDASSSAAI